jgi:iron complex outermembrane receptor protein
VDFRAQAPLIFLLLAASAMVHAQQPTRMPTIEVNERFDRRGSEADAYRVDSVYSLGPLGTSKILDLPFAVSVLPRDLIENSQAKNFKDMSKYLPLVAYQEQQGPQILRPQTRGMQGGNFQNSRMDGMSMYVTVANAMEQFEQIEVVSGVSASLYGPANPSGMFNFVSKRPTQAPYRRLNLSYDQRTIGTAHVDIGGPADANGVMGYRVNVLAADGEGYVTDSSLNRKLGALALDVHPRKDMVVELTLSDYRLSQKGYPGWFTYGQAIVLPKAPDPTRVGYGQSYAGVEMKTQTGNVRFRYDIAPNWRLLAGILYQDADRDINTPVNNLRNNTGTYISSFGNGFAPRFRIASDMGYLNGTFTALGVAHDLTLGTAGYKSQSYAVKTPASAASVLLGTASIDNPQVFPEPAGGPPNTSDNFNSSNIYQQGVSIGDTVTFDPAWSARLVVSQDWVHVANYNVSGATLPGYSDSGASPTVAVMFKPRVDMTAYLTYASSLQAGDIAPGTAANANVGLPPYRSKQYEAGFKASLPRVDLIAAIFRIERPFANVDTADNVFKIMGDQVNTGLELSAIGEVVRGLTLYGGFTILNAKLESTGNAATDGKRFVGAPRYKGNVLLEYRVPPVPGLTAVFDWQYSSNRAGNDTNSFFVDGYSLFDIGARYATRIMDRNTTWRLAVNNVTDRHYWSTIAPSNITGTNAGNLVAHLGSPRTVAASVSIDF